MARATLAACLALAGALVAPSALADEAVFDVDGGAVGTDRSVVIRVAPGHLLSVVRVDYGPGVFTGDYSPLQGAGGPCFGALAFEAGTVEGSGFCTWTDPDGGLAVLEWRAVRSTPQGVGGDWTARGGTGKWAGAEGGGVFEASPGGAAQAEGVASLRLIGRLVLR